MILREDFWSSESERMVYSHAVETHPLQPGQGWLSYLQRIVALVEGRYKAAGQVMPGRMNRRARDARLQDLRRQAAEIQAETEAKV